MTKNLKKLYSILLAVVLVLSVFSLSITAYAADDVIPTLQLDVAQTVVIDDAGKTVVYAFTAPTTDVYAFEAYADTESEDELDNVGVLLDSQLNTVAADDDSGKGYNFYLAYPMTAGETYYLGIAFYDETVTGSFDVEAKLSEVVDVNFGSVTIDEYDPERYDENFDYNEETGEYDLVYNYYFYDDLVPYEIVLRDGTRLTGVGSHYEYEGEDNFIDHYDSQGYGSEWTGGNTYEVVFSAFGFMEIGDVTIVGEIKTGWQYDGQGWYFNDSNGNKVTNCWMADSNGWCYLGVDGYMVTNSWVMDSVGWCYLGSDGYCVTNCWMADSYGWCYLDAEGRMATNQWVKDSVGWCYIGADGYCITNSWMKDSIGWCYLDANGRMVYDQWVRDSVGWCYVGSDGYMLYNYVVEDSYGYCFVGADGYMVYNQWVADGSDWFYVGADGYIVFNQWVKDGTGWCYIGSDGYMVYDTWERDSTGWCYINEYGYVQNHQLDWCNHRFEQGYNASEVCSCGAIRWNPMPIELLNEVPVYVDNGIVITKLYNFSYTRYATGEFELYFDAMKTYDSGLPHNSSSAHIYVYDEYGNLIDVEYWAKGNTSVGQFVYDQCVELDLTAWDGTSYLYIVIEA